MKLLGQDIPAEQLLKRIRAKVKARGLEAEDSGPIDFSGAEARVDPLSFNLTSLEENADSTRPLPIHTHRAGLSRMAVLVAKTTFRKGFQVFINEAFARQRVFNAHVRDSYAQLAAEVIELRAEVERLKASAKPNSAEPRKPGARPTRSI